MKTVLERIFPWLRKRREEREERKFWDDAARERRVFAKQYEGGAISALVPASTPNNCGLKKRDCDLWPHCAGFDGMCHATVREQTA